MSVKRKLSGKRIRLFVVDRQTLPPRTKNWIQAKMDEPYSGNGIVTTSARILLERGILVEPGVIETRRNIQWI